MLRDILRHPLLHFLILGAGLFLLYAVLTDEPAAGADREIVVSTGRLENLRQLFSLTWQRQPTPAELDGLVEDFVREEVYYREALALGLDRDDTIVRRRLRQKYEFLAADTLTAGTAPTDAELTAFLASHPERFAPDVRYSFEQVYLDPQKRGDRVGEDAAALLARLGDAGASPATGGDPLLISPEFSAVGTAEVEALFGPGFAAALAGLPVGQWAGPVESGYGLHLVRVSAAETGTAPSLAAIRETVARAFMDERRRQATERNYRELRARYRVIVEPATGSAPSLPP